MPFRFIHTADWQIAKPYARFSPALAGELAAARLAAIGRIAGLARAHAAPFVLVAGDVFDSDKIDTLTVRRTLELLRAQADVRFVLLPGNHDPARPAGIWERVRRIGLPANVAVADTPEPFVLADGVFVLPAPLTSKAPGFDPTAYMDACETPPGSVRIGLAHGSIQGFSGEGDSAVNIAPGRAAPARLDYLALGDWHGTARIDARTWYSGTPEPDRYPANAPGQVLCVTLEPGQLPHVEQLAASQFTWVRLDATLAGAEDVAGLSAKIETASRDLAHTLVRLKLGGRLTLSQTGALSAWREEIEGRLRHLDLDDSALVVTAGDDDLGILGDDEIVRGVARALGEAAAREDGGVAARALRKLYALAADAAREDA